MTLYISQIKCYLRFAFATIPITTENCWLVEQRKRQTFHYMIFENINEQKLHHYYYYYLLLKITTPFKLPLFIQK